MANDPSTSLLTTSELFDLEDIIDPLNGAEDITENAIEREDTPEPLSYTEMDILMRKVEELGSGGSNEVVGMVSCLFELFEMLIVVLDQTIG